MPDPVDQPPTESVEFTGDALDFLRNEANQQGKSVEDVVSSAVSTYAFLKAQTQNDGAQVVVEKGTKRSKLDLA